MYVYEQKAGPLSLQSCWHQQVLETMIAASIETRLVVKLDRVRALHAVDDFLHQGSSASPSCWGLNGAAPSVVVAKDR